METVCSSMNHSRLSVLRMDVFFVIIFRGFLVLEIGRLGVDDGVLSLQ